MLFQCFVPPDQPPDGGTRAVVKPDVHVSTIRHTPSEDTIFLLVGGFTPTTPTIKSTHVSTIIENSMFIYFIKILKQPVN